MRDGEKVAGRFWSGVRLWQEQVAASDGGFADGGRPQLAVTPREALGL